MIDPTPAPPAPHRRALTAVAVLAVVVTAVSIGAAELISREQRLDGVEGAYPSWAMLSTGVVVVICLALVAHAARGAAALLALGAAATALPSVLVLVSVALVPEAKVVAGIVGILAGLGYLWVLVLVQRMLPVGGVMAVDRAVRQQSVGHGVVVTRTPPEALTPRERAALDRLLADGFQPVHEISLAPASPVGALVLRSPEGDVIGEVVLRTGDESVPDGPSGFLSISSHAQLTLLTMARSVMPRTPSRLVQCLPGAGVDELLDAHRDGCAALAERGIRMDRLPIEQVVPVWLDQEHRLCAHVAAHPITAMREMHRYARRGDHSVGRLRDRPEELDALAR